MKIAFVLLIGCMVMCFGVLAQTPVPECTSHTGDVDEDGSVTAGDAQRAFIIAMGMQPTFDEWCAADCNGDGQVTSGDAQAIFGKMLGLVDCVEVPTATPTPTNTPFSPGSLISIDPIVGNMGYVPAGTFTQGSLSGEPCRGGDETQFTHQLTRNLAVMETEVTRQMWAALREVQGTLPADPSNTTYSPTMSHPVQRNTWYESVLFCNLLSLQNGYTRCYYTDALFVTPVDATNYRTDPFYCDFDADGYRLATEGEWEYLCRAGTTTAFSCNEPAYTSVTCEYPYCVSGEFPVLEQYAVYCANDPGLTEPVGSKLSNPWKLKDVHGNVYEWCWDWYGTYPSGPETDYEGAGSGSSRVVRGGGWSGDAQGCRSADRGSGPPGDRYSFLGTRFLRSID